MARGGSGAWRRRRHRQRRWAPRSWQPPSRRTSRCFDLPGLYFDAQTTYDRVHDLLLDSPSVTFEHVVDALAEDYGMIPEEIVRRYRRLAYWYGYYRQEEAEDARTRLQYADQTGMQDTQRRYWHARLAALTR